jgi:hypothetical protein
MQQVIMPVRGDDFCVPCQDAPCSGVRLIGEILGELLGTIDSRQRQNMYDVSGPFRLTTASGRTQRDGR